MAKRKQVTERFTLRCGHEDLYTHNGSPRAAMERYLSHSGPVCMQCQIEKATKEREGTGGSDPSSSA